MHSYVHFYFSECPCDHKKTNERHHIYYNPRQYLNQRKFREKKKGVHTGSVIRLSENQRTAQLKATTQRTKIQRTKNWLEAIWQFSSHFSRAFHGVEPHRGAFFSIFGITR